jgi:hypothetical protein
MKLSGGDSLCFLKEKNIRALRVAEETASERKQTCRIWPIRFSELNSMLLLREILMVNFSDYEQNHKQIFCFAPFKYLEIGTTSM